MVGLPDMVLVVVPMVVGAASMQQVSNREAIMGQMEVRLEVLAVDTSLVVMGQAVAATDPEASERKPCIRCY